MEVKLNPNGWHKRLQKFVFKYPPHFYNFCPYFWVTIFCILITFIIPIVPLIKVIKYTGMGIGWIFIKIMDFFNDNICEPLFEHIVKNMPEEDLMKAWTIDISWNGTHGSDWYNSPEGTDFLFWRDDYTTLRNMTTSEKDKYNTKFQVWKKNTPDWEQRIADIKIRQKEFWLKMAEQREIDRAIKVKKKIEAAEERIKNADKIKTKEIRKKQTINAIIKYTKWLAYGLGISIIAGAGYGVYWLVDWIYNAVVWYEFWPKFQYVMKWIGIWTGALITLIALVYATVIILKKCAISIEDIPGMRPLGSGIVTFSMWNWKLWLFPALNQAARFILWLAGGAEFLWIYLKTLKENNCPEIVWEEKKPKNI